MASRPNEWTRQHEQNVQYQLDHVHDEVLVYLEGVVQIDVQSKYAATWDNLIN